MALDAARGLLYLHLSTPALIHCDVKSPNILVDSSWRAKASTTGLCVFREASPKQSCALAARISISGFSLTTISGPLYFHATPFETVQCAPCRLATST